MTVHAMMLVLLLTQGEILWNGETAASQAASLFQNGGLTSSVVHSGSYAFEGTPTVWAAPSIGLSGQPMFRRDIGFYDRLEFWARADAAGKTFAVSVETWAPSHQVSAPVGIDPYIEGGALDTTWRRVSIPLSALKTSTYALESVDRLIFGVAQPSAGHKVYIDDVRVVDQTAATVEAALPLSNRVVRLTVSERYDFAAAVDPARYALSSPGDAAFSPALHPVQAGRRSYLKGYRGGTMYGHAQAPIVAFELFLVFDAPMKNGFEYALTVSDLPDAYGNHFASPQLLGWTFDDTALINGSVKASHVGYLPGASKFGYLGNYLGDLGMMDVPPTTCEVRNASTHAVVFSAPAQFRADDPVLSGERVYEADFSAVTAPGSYYLYAPGVGRTHAFKIGAGVFDAVAYATSRVYYFQRAGIDLPPTHAGAWARNAGHAVTDASATIHGSHTGSLLWNGEVVGSTVDMRRGWYDAGDYGKYVLTAAGAVFELLTAYELFPEKFADGALDLPESGNGVPDLLDEIRWELDWLRTMQAPDGGVYDRLVTTAWATTMPEGDVAVRYIAPKTTHTTAVYAAALAMASRSLQPHWPAYAQDLLERAKKAWTFLTLHPAATPSGGFVNPPGIGGGAYVDPDGDLDGRAWAAAELYKSTGDPAYAAAFLPLWTAQDPIFGWNDFQHHQRKASFAYATTDFPTNGALVAAYLDALKVEADTLVARTHQHAYRHAGRSDVLAWIGWGSYSQSARTGAWPLIKAYALLGDPAYREAALVNLDVQLGANPMYASFITGIGYDAPRRPLHTPSALDGAEAPVPGIPVFGVHAQLPMANDYHVNAASASTLYPAGKAVADPYPVLRRYYDATALVAMSEFSVLDLAHVVAAFSFASSGQGPSGGDTVAPTVSIVSPPAGAVVSGQTPISAVASDNVGVTAVQFMIDGQPIGAPVAVEPFGVLWDASAAAAGGHVLTATAFDAAGNAATSPAVAVTVAGGDPGSPQLSAIGVSWISATTATITWLTDVPADSQVEYGLTEAYGTAGSLDGVLSTNHAVVLTDLTPGTTYHFRVTSKDAAGAEATSEDFVFTTATGPAFPFSCFVMGAGSGRSGVSWMGLAVLMLAAARVRSARAACGRATRG